MVMLLAWFLGLCLICAAFGLLVVAVVQELQSPQRAELLRKIQLTNHAMSALYSRPASDSGPFPVDATPASSDQTLPTT